MSGVQYDASILSQDGASQMNVTATLSNGRAVK
jgi:hypothetical protein